MSNNLRTRDQEPFNFVDGLKVKGVDIDTKYVSVDSPTFIGEPKAPTAPLDTSTNQIATTEFVQTVLTNNVPPATTATPGKVALAATSDTTSTDRAVTPMHMVNYVTNAVNNLGNNESVFGTGSYLIFKNPGVTEFNTPPGITRARISVLGPGGNGIDPNTGALAAGGGGGGYSQGVYDISGNYTVTVGEPGVSSSFGTLISATSGEHGSLVNGVLVGGLGGVGIGGNRINRAGGKGSGGPVSPPEYIEFIESNGLTGSGTIPSGVTTVTMIGKGQDSVASAQTAVGKPWENQYSFNSSQNGDLTTWYTLSAPSNMPHSSKVVVTKNRVYVLGGISGYDVSNLTFTASIDSNGIIGSWTQGSSLPIGLAPGEAIVLHNRIYLFGGQKYFPGSAEAGGVYRQAGIYECSDVFSAPINNDGTIGNWRIENSMPVPIGFLQIIINKNRLYLYATNDTFGITANINPDGTLGQWSSYISLPDGNAYQLILPVQGYKSIITNNRIYLLGSYEGSNYTTKVHTATINPDGSLSAFNNVASNPLPARISGFQTLVTKNKVYLIGGTDWDNTVNYRNTKIYSAAINNDGTLGNWVQSGTITQSIYTGNLVVTSTKVYLLGVWDGGNLGTSNIVNNYHTSFIGGLNDYTAINKGQIVDVLNLDSSSGSGSLNSSVVNVTLTGKGEDGVALNNYSKPWIDQYDFNISQIDDIPGMQSSGTIPHPRDRAQAVVTKNKVYFIGGGGLNTSSIIYVANINSDGTLGAWSSAGSLPVELAHFEAIIIKNRLYIIGGYSNDTSGIYSNHLGYRSSVYTAVINNDGTIGPWSNGPSLPRALIGAKALVIKNKLYLIGGGDGITFSTANTIYTAVINNDGTIGPWVYLSSMPVAIHYFGTFVVNDKLYLIGGINYSSGLYNQVFTANINPDGTLGQWVELTSLPVGLYGFSTIVTKNSVYILGGSTTNNAKVNTIYKAAINPDGTLGQWRLQASRLGAAMLWFSVIITNARVYTLGGWANTGTTDAMYSAPFSGGLNDYSSIYSGISISGSNATITFNGTVYNFPGGLNGAIAPVTNFEITLPGTTAANYSYNRSGTSSRLTIIATSNNVGLPTTITINGVVYTFNGGINGPAVQSIQTAYLTGASTVNYSYSLAPGGYGNISYRIVGGDLTGNEGASGGANGCFSEVFMRDAYGLNGGGLGNGIILDDSVSGTAFTRDGRNFSGGAGSNTGNIVGGKGGIGAGGGRGAVGGDGLIIVEF